MNQEQQPQEVLESLSKRAIEGDKLVVNPDDRKTIFDLQELVERCFIEAKEAGIISSLPMVSVDPGVEKKVDYIVNETDLAKHIALTLIGELHEFEVIRRISPLFREIGRLQKDFQYFDEREAANQRMAGLRIAAEG